MAIVIFDPSASTACVLVHRPVNTLAGGVAITHRAIAAALQFYTNRTTGAASIALSD